MQNPLTTIGQIVSDLAFLAGLVRPTPERNRRRARRKVKRARRATRRSDLDKARALYEEANALRFDADLMARGK